MIASLRRLSPFIYPYRLRWYAGIAAFGVARAFEAIVPFLTAEAINRMVDSNFRVGWLVAGIAAAVSARYVVVSFARYAVRTTGLNIAYDLRQKLYSGLQDQGAEFFSKHSIGDMMTRAVADIMLVQRLISMGTILIIILVYASLFGFGFMLYYSPFLTLLIIPVMPFVFWYARYSSRLMGVASIAVQNRLSDLGTHVQENLSGIRTIQAMVQEENEIHRFSDTNQAYSNAFMHQARINSAMESWMPSLAAMCQIIILSFGGFQVLEGDMRLGDFVAFFMYVRMVVQPFRVAGMMVNLFQRAAISADRLFEIMDLSPEIDDAPSGTTPTLIAGDIHIDHLSYTYPDSKTPVINDVSLHISKGETIAIMGRVGSGKTTLLKQMVRLLDPTPGSITIDQYDVQDYPLSQLRAQLAMVPQDPFLFGEPLKENLTYDDPNRALDDIWSAATSADFADSIKEFPDQLSTLVGERGVTLSGGQKQRATLARGFIRHAPVLILDDCFSAVDTETEEHILSELKRLRRNQTTILVSHRVSTARHADRIVILEHGRILELGTHEQLLASGGYYAELERVQREGADEENFASLRSTT